MSATPRIIGLWTAARSISSAFERTFAQRSDVDTYFEPFFNIYHFSNWRQSTRLGEYANARDYSPARAMEKLRSGKADHAFFKEMAFIYLPYRNPEFLKGITNTFLIRRPEFSLMGLLKMDQSPTEEMLGFGKLLDLWKLVTEELGQQPIVVEASDFQHDPEGSLRKYCRAVGIDFDPGMLSWEAKEHQTWDKELMTDEAWTKWQATLNKSTSILPPPRTIPDIPARYRKLLKSARAVYDEISAHAL